MSVLKPKRLSSQQEDQDKIQYIQVKTSSQIKAILKAQKTTVQKEDKPLIPEKQNAPKETPQPAQQKKEKKFAFIKDDRERQYPKQREQPKQKFKPKPQDSKQSTKSNLKEKKESSKKLDEKQKLPKQQKAKQRKIYKDDIQEQEQEYPSKKIKYVQKRQESDNTPQKQAPSKKGKYVQKIQQKPQYQQNQSKKGKYVEKGQEKTYKNKEKRLKNRIQIQTKNGEQIQVQLLQNENQFQNQIFIGKKAEKEYISLCKILLKKYDFIVVKAFGNLVSKAFLIAGLLGEGLQQLRQINIPSTVKVNEFSRGENKSRTRGAISIELSLNSLDKRHIGYQDSNNKNFSKTNEKKNIQKPKPNRQFKEKEENQRQLR